MKSKQRSFWDDVQDIGREIWERLGELMNPEKKRRKLARVPVPVRSNHPRQR